MQKLLLILYCAFVTLNATHTHFTYIIKIISKGKKEGENNKGKWAILQPETFTTNWMNNSPRVCLYVLHCNTRQTKKDIRPLGIFCSTWRLGPCSHDAISGKKAFKHFVFICRWELVPTGFQLVLHWKRTSYFSLLLIWKSNFLKPYLRRSRR